MTSQPAASPAAPLAPEFTRARLIPRADYRDMQACVETALEILEICIRTVRGRDDLLEMAVANHPMRELMLSCADDEAEAIARFDAFVDDDGVMRFLEYNPGLCGGAFNSYRAAKLYLETPDGQALSRQSPLEAVDTPRLFVDAVWTGCRNQTGRDAGVVALIWPGQAPAGEAVPREMAAFETLQAERGGRFLMLPWETVDRRGDALWSGDTRLDAVFMMDWEAMSWGATHLAGSLPQTWVANTVGSGVFRGGKHLFAVMSDPELGAPLSGDQRAFVERHIPWTRMLKRGDDTSPAAKALREHARDQRQDLILKPSLGRGGKGIIAGWDVSEAEWEAAITSPTADSCLMQQRVYPRLEDPFDDRVPPGEKVLADLCMFIWDNKHADGIVSRAAQSWLLNVAAGEAKAVPVLVQG